MVTQTSLFRTRATLVITAAILRFCSAAAMVLFKILSTSPVYQGNALKQIVVRDFDGDGNLDFAVANYGMNQIAVLKGAGDGTFTRLTEVSAGAGTFGLETTDLNGDGVMDLVASNASSSTLSISLGNGDGSFTSASNYPTGSFPQRLSIGDTNEDGLPDLAVSSRAGDSVSLLLMQDAH